MRIAPCLTLLLLLTAAVAAEPSLKIAGTVADPSGAAIGGALVELSGMGEPVLAETDAGGRFVLIAAAPGDYLLSVVAEDFEPCSIALSVTQPMEELACVLQLAAQTTTVEVSAADPATDTTDPARNADRVEITREELQLLPALDGDLLAAVGGMLDGDGFGGSGGGLVVDGMETAELGVSPSAIQEIRINKDPYSAEFSRPGNARIEVITKKGAENLHGQLNLRIRNHLLDARNAFADVRPDQRRFGIEGNLVGPIGAGGRHSFVLSGEHDRDREAKTVFATTPSGIRRDAVLAPDVETEASARWDFHPNYENAFSLRYEFEHRTERNNGVGGFALPEVGSDGEDFENKIYWRYRRVLGPTSLLSWSGRVGRETVRDWSLNDGSRVIVGGAFSAGGAQRDSRQVELYGESSAIFSHEKGRHMIRTGVLLRDLERTRFTDRNNFGGTFRFATLEDFAAGRPLSYSFRAGDPTLAFWNVAVAGFVQDNIRLNERSTLALGLRYDRQNYAADPDNFAPRASFAIGLGEERRTTIRVGGGIFYDNIDEDAYEDRLRFNGVRVLDVLVRNPSYPEPGARSEADGAVPPNLVTWAPRLATPYVAQYSASVERRLTKRLVWTANWTNSVGVGLLRSRDLNAPLPGSAIRPDGSVGIHRRLESSARSERYGVNTQVRGRLAKFFQGTARYSWGRAMSDRAGDDDLPADSRDLSREWGPAGFDRRHRLDLIGSVNVREWFQMGVIFEADSATPYTLTTGLDDNADGLTGDRPVGVGRNTERGEASRELDVRLSRSFAAPALGGDEPTRLALTLDAFNILNTVNLRGFVGNMSSPLFGQATSAGSARRLQAGLRWSF